jgi:hypothetical protein
MDFLQHLLDWGLNGNVWIWFHMLGGAAYAKVALLRLSALYTMLSLFAITILWEVIEFIGGGGIEGMVLIYGSIERWAYDSLGDVLGAMVMGLFVL